MTDFIVLPRKSVLVSGTALALVLLAGPVNSLDMHGAPPPVITAPPQPPRVYQPPVLPPVKQQAVPSNKPSAAKPKAASPSEPAPTPQKSAEQIASEKAAAEAQAAERETVRTLQQRLADLGHDPGPVDGLIGNRTRGALTDWIDSLTDDELAARARDLAAAEDYAGLAGLVGNDNAGSEPAEGQLQLAVPVTGSGAGGSAGNGGDGGDGSGSGGGSGGEGGGSGWVSNRKPVQLVPDAEVERILAMIEADDSGLAPEEMMAELQALEVAPQDEATVSAIDAELAANVASGKAGFYSFAERKRNLELVRDRLLEQIEASDQMGRLAEARAAYYTALGHEQVVVDRSYTEANKRVTRSVESAMSRLESLPKFVNTLSAMLAEAISKGYSKSWTDLTRRKLEGTRRQINDLVKVEIPHLKSQEYFIQQLSAVLIDYSGTPYSWGDSPRFNEDGVLVNRESETHKRNIETHYRNLQAEHEALEKWKQDVRALQDDIAEFRASVAVSGQVEEDLADMQDDLGDTQTEAAEDLLEELAELEEPEEIKAPEPDPEPEPDPRPDPAPGPDGDAGDGGPGPDGDAGGDGAGPDGSGDGAGPDAGGGPDAGTAGGGGSGGSPDLDEEYLAGADDPAADLAALVERKQSEITQTLESADRARAELASIRARDDIPPEQKANIISDIEARIQSLEIFAKSEQATLAALGGSYDATERKDVSGFDPYALNQTDIELARISEEQKATERFYDELARARQTIRDTADGLDAIELQDRVTTLSERLVENAAQIDELASNLHDYADGIRVTREQGELEYLAAMAEDTVLAAERNLAYTESVYRTSKNANLLLLLGAAGGAAFGIGGVTAAEAAAAQAVMAGFEGTTGAIEGYDQGGFTEALKKGGTEAGKYYLPINTALAVERGDDKTGIALGIVSDAAILFTGYKTARTQLDKAQAAQAAVTRQSLSASEKAVSDAARQAAEKADDLIAGYQTAKWNAQQARATGMIDDVAEATLQNAVKAIDRSDEAKLALKALDPKLQYQFVQDQAKIVKTPAQLAWEKTMRELGWSDAGLKTAQIRNTSSAGTVGLDDDIRLLEPSLLDTLDDGVTRRYSGPNDPALAQAKADFRKSLTRNGEAASLTQWEQDAKTAMEQAYRDTVGYSASEARINMTTSVNPEAYSDIGLLTGEGGSAGWAEQTAAVTRTKIRDGVEAAEAMGLGSSAPTTSLSGTALEAATTEARVAARELLKDLAGKALRARPDMTLPQKVERQLRILDGLARGVIDPAVANRQLITETGTTLAKTMDTLGGQVEVILKLN